MLGLPKAGPYLGHACPPKPSCNRQGDPSASPLVIGSWASDKLTLNKHICKMGMGYLFHYAILIS